LDGVDGIDKDAGYDVSYQKVVDINRTLSPLKTEANLTITPAIAENPSGHDTYQWFKDGVAISGATSRVYTKENITLDDAGVYTYEVKNSVIKELTLKSHKKGEGFFLEVTDIRAEVIEDIAGNADGKPATAEQINAIKGVSGAIDGVDYSSAFEAGTYEDRKNPTAQEIQAVIDGLNNIMNYVDDNSNAEPSVENYKAIGVTDVDSSNLEAINKAIAEATSKDDVNTPKKIQAIVDITNNVKKAVEAAEGEKSLTNSDLQTVGVDSNLSSAELKELNEELDRAKRRVKRVK